MNQIHIRPAVLSDLPALTDIYNDAVLHTTATLDLEPRSVEDRRPWFLSHNIGNHPLIVAVTQEGCAVGYASLSELFDKEAYSSSTELSVYVHPLYRGQGIGDRLMCRILQMAREDETIHTVVSKITAGNVASDRMHEKYGFRKVGTLREAAYKFGQALDVDLYQLFV